jgi:hypothetical protein
MIHQNTNGPGSPPEPNAEQNFTGYGQNATTGLTPEHSERFRRIVLKGYGRREFAPGFTLTPSQVRLVTVPEDLPASFHQLGTEALRVFEAQLPGVAYFAAGVDWFLPDRDIERRPIWGYTAWGLLNQVCFPARRVWIGARR